MPSYFRQRARNPYLRDIPQDDNAAPEPIAVAPQAGRMATLTPAPQQRQGNTASSIIDAASKIAAGAIASYGDDDNDASPTFAKPRATMPDVRATTPPFVSDDSRYGPDDPMPMRAVTPPVVAKPTPTPLERIESARGEYEAKVPTGFVGRLGNALKTAGLGFVQGAASNPTDPLGSGLGGAATAGVLSAVSPKLGRGYQFEALEKPRIEGQIAIEAERAKMQQAAEDRARVEAQAKRDADYKTAQTKNINSEIDARDKADKLARDKFEYDKTQPKLSGYGYGTTVIDEKTGKKVFQTRDKPNEPTYAEKRDATNAEIVAREGTIEAAAQKKFEAARQSGTYLNQLTRDEQNLVNYQKDSKGRSVKPDDPKLIRAQNRLAQIENRAIDSLRRQIDQERNAKVSGGTRTSSGAAPKRQASSRPLSSFSSDKFPGLRLK